MEKRKCNRDKSWIINMEMAVIGRVINSGSRVLNGGSKDADKRGRWGRGWMNRGSRPMNPHAEEASTAAAIAALNERDAYRNNTSSVSTAFTASFLHPEKKPCRKSQHEKKAQVATWIQSTPASEKMGMIQVLRPRGAFQLWMKGARWLAQTELSLLVRGATCRPRCLAFPLIESAAINSHRYLWRGCNCHSFVVVYLFHISYFRFFFSCINFIRVYFCFWERLFQSSCAILHFVFGSSLLLTALSVNKQVCTSLTTLHSLSLSLSVCLKFFRCFNFWFGWRHIFTRAVKRPTFAAVSIPPILLFSLSLSFFLFLPICRTRKSLFRRRIQKVCDPLFFFFFFFFFFFLKNCSRKISPLDSNKRTYG